MINRTINKRFLGAITHKASNYQAKNFFNLPRRKFSTPSNRLPETALIPQLPILEEMAKRIKANQFPSLDDVAIIGVQHILPTTASLFDIIINHFGIDPKSIFLAGKFYSSCPSVEEYMRSRGIHVMQNKIPDKAGQFEELMRDTAHEMWGQFAEHLSKSKKKKIIIFDEGSHCLETIPRWLLFQYSLASLEQTRFGLYTENFGRQVFPLIDVCCSAAKKHLESPIISKAIVRRVKEVLPKLAISPKTIFGIVGNGSIGSAIADHLLSLGFIVVGYDKNEKAFRNISDPRNFFLVENVETVLDRSDIVFGCTGRDITKGVNVLKLIKQDITLISSSSQDVEFKELLQSSDKIQFNKGGDGSFSSLNLLSHSGAKITILENGFPINFDRTFKSDFADDMELTRGLLLSAFIQAVMVAAKPINISNGVVNKSRHIMLDPYMQQFVAQRWIQRQLKDKCLGKNIKSFDDISWIQSQSLGEYVENDFLFNAMGNKSDNESKQFRTLR